MENPSEISPLNPKEINISSGFNSTSTSNNAARSNFGTLVYYSVLAFVAIAGLISIVTVIFIENNRNKNSENDDIPFIKSSHPLQPTSVWGAFTRPFPTGAWFTNMVLDSGDQPIVALPYSNKVSSAGVGISFSAYRRQVSSSAIIDVYDDDLVVSAAEDYSSHYISRFDNFSVSVYYELSDGTSFETYLIKGSPYVTFNFDKSIPVISSKNSFIYLSGSAVNDGDVVTGKNFKVVLSNWQTWIIYTSDVISFTVNSFSLTGISPFCGQVRVAFLPSASNYNYETDLNEYSSAYATGGKVNHFVEGDTVTTTFEWDVKGSGKLLMLALPHHLDAMDTSSITNSSLVEAYQTSKGRMTGIIGSTWTLYDNLTTIGFGFGQLEHGWAADRVEIIREALQENIASISIYAEDIYGFSKQSASVARLALIADELDEEELKDQALNALEEAMIPWLLNENNDLFVYDETWGGIVTYNSLQDNATDYGNAWYNDHHFHYGYFTYAAAVLSYYRIDFYTENQLALDYIISDIVCLSSLYHRFPVARHKDFFDGHSWASGLFSQGNGKSQESNSEAVNAYYAVYLMGLATSNTEMADAGRILLASEIRSAQRYWQISVNSDIYDSIFAANRMVGVVGAIDVSASTWFGDNVEYVHGINMMPYTPISEELLSSDFIMYEWPVLLDALSRTSDPVVPQWASYLYMAYAIVDPSTAWDSLIDLSAFDSANSKTNALYWVASRKTPDSEYDVETFELFWLTEMNYVPTLCSENTACFAQGIDYSCCPTASGDYLECCPQSPKEIETAECVNNSKCAALGLGLEDSSELCCPTSSYVYLDCCDVYDETSSPTSAVASDGNASSSCSDYAGCSGLYGECCPTQDGVFLDCCYN